MTLGQWQIVVTRRATDIVPSKHVNVEYCDTYAKARERIECIRTMQLETPTEVIQGIVHGTLKQNKDFKGYAYKIELQAPYWHIAVG